MNLSSVITGGIVGGITGTVVPFFQYGDDDNVTGEIPFYMGILHNWGVYYLVVLVAGLFLWSAGKLTTDTVVIMGSAFLAHCLAAYIISSTIIPVLDLWGVSTLVGNAAKKFTE